MICNDMEGDEKNDSRRELGVSSDGIDDLIREATDCSILFHFHDR